MSCVFPPVMQPSYRNHHDDAMDTDEPVHQTPLSPNRQRAYTTNTGMAPEVPKKSVMFQTSQEIMTVNLPHTTNSNGANHANPVTFEFNLEDHIKKTRKAANYLKQVFHCQGCLGMSSDYSASVFGCHYQWCPRIKRLLQHILHCEDVYCQAPGCMTTKKLLKHVEECQIQTPRSVTATLTSPSTPHPLHHSASKVTSFQTRPSTNFCLLCTIARADCNNIRNNSIDPSCYNTNDDNDDDDDRFMPVISDEIIEFNRVPFQSYTKKLEVSDDSHIARVKTYSDSDYLSNGNGSNGQPSKKLRSKSLNQAQAIAQLQREESLGGNGSGSPRTPKTPTVLLNSTI